MVLNDKPRSTSKPAILPVNRWANHLRSLATQKSAKLRKKIVIPHPGRIQLREKFSVQKLAKS
jgi:hypothetical protein